MVATLSVLLTLFILVSLLFGYLLVRKFPEEYIKEKAKNLATKEDIKVITEMAEKIRSDYELKREVLSTRLDVLKNGYHAADGERIAAIKEMWVQVTDLRYKAPKEYSVLNILTDEECVEALQNPRDSVALKEVGEDLLDSYVASHERAVDKLRPFLGEELYALYSVYRIVHGRIGVLMLWLKEGKITEPWSKDAYLLHILSLVLSTEEIAGALEKTKIGKITNIENVLETKILSEVSKILSGETAERISAENILEILAADIRTRN